MYYRTFEHINSIEGESNLNGKLGLLLINIFI